LVSPTFKNLEYEKLKSEKEDIIREVPFEIRTEFFIYIEEHSCTVKQNACGTP